jgi:hypothetical protein
MRPQAMVKHRWFWVWQDHKEEAWLESMSRDGWHLKDVGFLTYIFEQGEPKEWVYRLDFRPSREMAGYIEFIREAGWQFIGKMSSWLYFRAPAEAGKTTELYTDAEGKIAKYRRVIGILVATSPGFWAVFASRLDRLTDWVHLPITIIFVTVIAIYAVSLIKLMGRIHQLRRT